MASSLDEIYHDTIAKALRPDREIWEPDTIRWELIENLLIVKDAIEVIREQSQKQMQIVSLSVDSCLNKMDDISEWIAINKIMDLWISDFMDLQTRIKEGKQKYKFSDGKKPAEEIPESLSESDSIIQKMIWSVNEILDKNLLYRFDKKDFSFIDDIITDVENLKKHVAKKRKDICGKTKQSDYQKK